MKGKKKTTFWNDPLFLLFCCCYLSITVSNALTCSELRETGNLFSMSPLRSSRTYQFYIYFDYHREDLEKEFNRRLRILDEHQERVLELW